MSSEGIGVPELQAASVPEQLAAPVLRELLIEATRDEILVRVPTVGRFLVRRQGPVHLERAPGATALDVRCFRDEAVAAAAALFRGALVLRAASVAIHGRGVVVCGPSGVGKSAVAAALAQRGHAVLADAVSVVSIAPDGTLPIATTAPEPVLWPDMVSELGLQGEKGRVVRPALAKRAYRLGPPGSESPAAAVVILSVDSATSEPVLEPLAGAARVRALAAVCWHARLVHALGATGAQFGVVTQLAATARCVRLIRPTSGAGPAALAELVEGLVS